MARNRTTGTIIVLLILAVGAFLLLRKSTHSPAPGSSPSRTERNGESPAAEDPEVRSPDVEPRHGVSGDPRLQLYFSNAYRNDPTIGEKDPANIDRKLLGFIASATTSLDGAFFEIESSTIADALIAARDRGVAVRLVLEDDYAGNDEVETLQRAGIPIVTDGRTGLMHNKFLVADGRRVWTGSVNATDNGAWRNNNNGIEIDSREIAENYSAEFHEMFEDGMFGPRSPSRTPHTLVKLGDVEIYNYFAPEDDVQGKILRFTRLAKGEIRFMLFSFTDDEIGTLMVERFREGVDVAGIMESRGSSLASSELGRFREAGLPVLTDANRYVMHHKVMVVDSLWTILGSYNFSASANERNDENIVILKSREIALQMLREYDRVAAMEVD